MKTRRLEIRLSEKEYNRILLLAKIYSDGNVSRWIIYQSIEGERRFLERKKRKRTR